MRITPLLVGLVSLAATSAALSADGIPIQPQRPIPLTPRAQPIPVPATMPADTGPPPRPPGLTDVPPGAGLPPAPMPLSANDVNAGESVSTSLTPTAPGAEDLPAPRAVPTPTAPPRPNAAQGLKEEKVAPPGDGAKSGTAGPGEPPADKSQPPKTDPPQSFLVPYPPVQAAPTHIVDCVPPPMIGDLAPYTQGAAPPGTPGSRIVPRRPILALAGSAIKIANFESPRPQDRVYLHFDVFDGVDRRLQGPGGDPGIQLDRQVFGFEKTFLGGDASIGFRAPFAQTHDTNTGADGTGASDFGDLTVIGKYWLLNDRVFNAQVTTGLAVTFPTGPTYHNGYTGAAIHTGFGQPFVAGVWTWGDVYVQGFSSFTFAGDSRVTPVFATDLGAGYYFLRNLGCVQSAACTVEVHGTSTPFSGQNANASPLAIPDTADVTAGLQIMFKQPVLLTIGVGTPCSGTRLYSTEYLVGISYRY